MTRYKLIKPSVFFVIGFLYLFSVLSWFLFPFVSISTGELKARELYVDENALLVNSVKYSYIYNTDNYHNVRDSKEESKSVDVINCKVPSDVHCYYFSKYSIYYSHIDPSEGKTVAGEGIFILIPLHSELKDIANDIVELLYYRLRKKSPWLSRRIIVVLMPIPSIQPLNFVSIEFDTWLSHYLSNSLQYDDDTNESIHSHGINNHNKNLEMNQKLSMEYIDVVHIRQAYVLNIFEASHSSLSKSDSEVLHLHIIGEYGQMPNMDLVSTTLAIHSNLPISIPASNCDLSSYSILQSYLSSSTSLLAYLNKLCGVLHFSYSMLTNHADGFHHYFLSRRIDALSITPVTNLFRSSQITNTNTKTTKNKNKQTKSRKSSNKNQYTLTLDDIVSVVMNLIHVSSNLHGMS